ncbi:MAG: tRNA pseudouridine(38-40) synthase TruA [Betaproteobacteria bacterium]|nr:tRNA pseudouridine(38-40) synthase TruA [Betaproteobacteria bacterium]
MKLAFGLEYDGTDFEGWQTQPSGNTVQDHLESALAQFVGGPVETVSAGRTDAGVHASGQVVHITASVDRPDWNWVRGVNTFLPAAIRVRWARRVSEDFHARFSALSRMYTYTIYNHPVDSPLHARFATWVFQPLDLAAMQAGVDQLIGTHDFSAFRATDCQAASPVRTIHGARFSQDGPVITLEIRGNAFLHHMVRNIMGVVFEVGRGARPPQSIAKVLQSRDRSQAGRTFPAQGLCLRHVAYDPPIAP